MDQWISDHSRKLDVIQTTIGDLVEVITEIAFEAGKSEQEGYHLASLTIEKILRDKARRIQHEQ
jgi:hypothetical protein